MLKSMKSEIKINLGYFDLDNEMWDLRYYHTFMISNRFGLYVNKYLWYLHVDRDGLGFLLETHPWKFEKKKLWIIISHQKMNPAYTHTHTENYLFISMSPCTMENLENHPKNCPIISSATAKCARPCYFHRLTLPSSPPPLSRYSQQLSKN